MCRRSCSSKLVWNTYCANRGAAIADAASRSSKAAAPIVRRSRRRLYHAFVQSPADARRDATVAGTTSARATVAISSNLDPRIHARVCEVTKQVADHQHRAGEHDPGHDEWVVLATNGRVRELADTRPGEDLLDDERATYKRREDAAERGHDRDQGVAECVDVHDRALAEALGTRGPNVVLRDHVERLCAQVARVVGDDGAAEHEGGQEDVFQTIGDVPDVLADRE